MNFRFNPIFKMLATAGLIGSLAACGGGGSSPSTVPISIKGVAATGLALAQKPYSVQCALPVNSPAKTGTTGDDGSYSVTMVPGSAGPCIVTITDGDKQLQSITPNNPSSGTTLVANVTPFSDLIVKALVSASDVTNATGLITGTTIPQNVTAVMATVVEAIRTDLVVKLQDSGLTAAQAQAIVDATLPVDTDLLADSNFKPATTANPANASPLDKLLDVLAGKPADIKDTQGNQLITDEVLTKINDKPPVIAASVVTDTIKDVIKFSNQTGTPIITTGAVGGGGAQ